MLRKVLRRSRRGIQYVEHTEGDGAEMFKAVCKLGLEGIVSKKLDAIQVGAIKGVVEDQKSKRTGSDTRNRGNVLIQL